MAASFTIHSSPSSVPTTRASTIFHGGRHHYQFLIRHNPNQASRKPLSLRVRAAKLPSGVEVPKVEPKFQAPFLGFTRTAEVWNSRACMIGLIGTFIVELIINKGILQVIEWRWARALIFLFEKFQLPLSYWKSLSLEK